MTYEPPAEPYATPTGPPPERPAAPPPGYGQPNYGQPGYGPPRNGPPRNGMGTAALVLGILGLLSFWTLIGGIVLGLLGLIFGLVGRRRAARGEANNGGMALAGVITGAVALALSAVIIAIGGVFFLHHKSDIQKLRDCLHNAQGHSDQQQCRDDFKKAIQG